MRTCQDSLSLSLFLNRRKKPSSEFEILNWKRKKVASGKNEKLFWENWKEMADHTKHAWSSKMTTAIPEHQK